MRSLFIKKSQRLSFPEINHTQKLLNHYGQMIIYLLAIGFISYFYISIQNMVMNYIDGLALGQLPDVTK